MYALADEAATGGFDYDSSPSLGTKKTREACGLSCFFGAPAGTRTPDTLLKRQVLYLLSYWGVCCFFTGSCSLHFASARGIPVGCQDACGWDGGTRTHYIGVKVRCVTITLHPNICRTAFNIKAGCRRPVLL